MIDRQELLPAAAARLSWLRRGLLLVLLALLGFLFDMQVLRTAEFQAQADINSMKRVRVQAPRGLLLDRAGRVLVKNRPAFEAVIYPDRVQDLEASLARARSVLGLDAPYAARLRKRLRRKNEPEILLKEDLSMAEVAALEARSYEWPEFRVRQGLVRSYPYGTAAAHVLGHMGEIREEQLQTQVFRDYEPGEIVGQSGIEARYQHYLRGKDGFRRVMVNNRGREMRELDLIDSPTPGLDLTLTLDLDVQQAAEAAFGNSRGAAVAIDNQTGEVLALVSRPAYDPNAFAGKLTREDWLRYNADPAHPLFDRALLGKLPPGSVFKVVDAVAGLEERTWDPDTILSCGGTTVLYGDVRHCWKKEGHGPVSFHEAMRGSCNVYFYHRGDAVGIDKISRWARRLGLGELTGIDVDPEGRGLIPDPAWKRRVRAEPWWPGETVSVAIGQGAVGVSVLQVAQMMQVIANGGRGYVPFVLQSVGRSGFRRSPVVARQVPLREETLSRVRKSLWAVVNEAHGTGGRARIEGFAVSGKTGTAQTPAQGIDPQDAKEHAWFAGYAPGTQPVAVVSVFVEHGGHGGEAAAPIAGAILARILEKKGLKVSDVVPAPPLDAVVEIATAPAFIGPPAPDRDLSHSLGLARFIGPPRATTRRMAEHDRLALARASVASSAAGGDGVAWAATPRSTSDPRSRVSEVETISHAATPGAPAMALSTPAGKRGAEAAAPARQPGAVAGARSPAPSATRKTVRGSTRSTRAKSTRPERKPKKAKSGASAATAASGAKSTPGGQ